MKKILKIFSFVFLFLFLVNVFADYESINNENEKQEQEANIEEIPFDASLLDLVDYILVPNDSDIDLNPDITDVSEIDSDDVVVSNLILEENNLDVGNQIKSEVKLKDITKKENNKISVLINDIIDKKIPLQNYKINVDFDFDRLVTNKFPDALKGRIKFSELNSARDQMKYSIFATLIEDSENPSLKAEINKDDIKIYDDDTFVIYFNGAIYSEYYYEKLNDKDRDYNLTVIIKDNKSDKIIFKKIKQIIIDNTAPKITIDPNTLTRTTNRTPTITGTVEDKTKTDINVTINSVPYPAVVDMNNGTGTWSVVIPNEDALPVGINNIEVKAVDEARNETTENSIIEIYTTGGGRRIYPLEVVSEEETTPVEEPTSEPTPITPTPTTPTDTGGETITEEIETPILEEVVEPVTEEIETPSGLTGFAGFASSPTGMTTIILGILVLLGIIGYFSSKRK